MFCVCGLLFLFASCFVCFTCLSLCVVFLVGAILNCVFDAYMLCVLFSPLLVFIVWGVLLVFIVVCFGHANVFDVFILLLLFMMRAFL